MIIIYYTTVHPVGEFDSDGESDDSGVDEVGQIGSVDTV